MRVIYADLHIHIGQSLDGKVVKITASKSLTLPNIIKEARDVKGLSLVGIIDAHSTGVRQDFLSLIEKGELVYLSGGGYVAKSLVIIPGTEVELRVGDGNAHFLAYFPTIAHIEAYVYFLKPYVKNLQLSSQKAFLPVEVWLEVVEKNEGVWFPAHAFTPHKGIYGNCCRRLNEVLPVRPQALEIGLSADRSMARSISELDGVQLFSNSDAHSLPKIAREYNVLELSDNSYSGFKDLLTHKSGRIITNFGFPPQVGKYHRTFCLVCEQVVKDNPPQLICPQCGSKHVVVGVLDRLLSIADRPIKNSGSHYIYQVPLRQLPGIGPKMYSKLLNIFGTEMAVLHAAPVDQLIQVGGEKIAQWIIQARHNELTFEAGGGGIFGRVVDIHSHPLE
ncbi:MAG: endonuclease Q family protein [Desulfitobacteriaceae bacterium]